jgi:hypothetical protein
VLATPAADVRDSAERLSGLVRAGLLKFSDLRENPDRFFEAHRCGAIQDLGSRVWGLGSGM